ncbi:MAG: arabinofuranosidase catalytic domain-containing protein [Pseudomonadota bacterium]
MNSRLTIVFTVGLVLPLTTLFAAQAAAPSRNALHRDKGPCDIFAAGGTPCVAAHSTTRTLSASYNGPLYQVMRQSDGKTLDIGFVAPAAADAGGYADALVQDAFCVATLCVITRIYDQSGRSNHLYQAPPGTFVGPAKGGFNALPIADMAPITIAGHKAYGAFIMPGMGLRNNDSTGIAINDEPEGIYYVIDGTHYDSGCCFDYGNSSTNSRAVGTGTMETTYFGTATAWGSGAGPGPWIMADMEAGLFSGYDAKQNVGSPTIDAWRFVTAVVNGGGGNKWDLRGGNAQQGELTTYYSGVRPGSPESNRYFPMNKKGGILMGNGGDNGNGSAGTFYEGVMTTGYPTDAATNAVQANIVAAKYAAAPVKLSRVTTFTPGVTQPVTLDFTNTTGAPVKGVRLSLSLPGWTLLVRGTRSSRKTFQEPLAPGASVSVTFDVTPPAKAAAGFLVGRSEWKDAADQTQTYASAARVHSAAAVRINEVFFGDGANPTNQFIELYNASADVVDISNWSLVSTQSQWAPAALASIPSGTKLPANSFYLLGLSSRGLVAPAKKGESVIHARSTADFGSGQTLEFDAGNLKGGDKVKIARVGSAATAMTTLFIPVSTGPWLTIPAGSTNVPVTNAAGFAVGEKLGIDLGGNYEIATVTAVGKAATQTTLTEASTAGATMIRVAAATNISVGDTLTIDTGGRKELATVRSVTAPAAVAEGVAGAAPGGGGRGGRGGGPPSTVNLVAPLARDHMSGIDVSDRGTGISFSPATSHSHLSGEAVQALGSGITLEKALSRSFPVNAVPVISAQSPTEGFKGPLPPQQWFGFALAPRAGSLALLDSSGKVVVDALVYGSQQSNSSANGSITSPELATLEGEQDKGGNMAVVPAAPRGAPGVAAAPASARSLGRRSDGADTDNLAADFQLQAPTPGAANQRTP